MKSARENAEEGWLTRAYWSREMIGAIERRAAVDLCRRIAITDSVSFEEGLSVLSAFCGIDYKSVSQLLDVTCTGANKYYQIKHHLDWLADKCRIFLHDTSTPIPGAECFDTERMCRGICTFMAEEGFLPAG